jgi:hypothetical protein
MPPHPSGHRWTAFARSVIGYYGGLCWCGHGGARQVDHVIASTERPDLVWDLRNCRPAHGAPGNPCLQCSAACGQKIYCNQLRGGFTIERARRIIAERAAAHAAGKTRRPGTPRVREAPGRAWLAGFSCSQQYG